MSGRIYPQQRDYQGALVIRIDPKLEEPIIEEIVEPLPREKRMPVYKKQAQYKFDVMNGQPHPMDIEADNYILVTIHTWAVNTTMFQQAPSDDWHRRFSFNADELTFIQSVSQRSEVEWAIDNSFDGLYVHKSDDPSRLATDYKFAVYLKEEQATFWKLKFHGR